MKHTIKTSIIFIALLFFSQVLPALSIGFRSFDHEGFTRMVLEADQSFTFSVRNLPGQIQLLLPKHADFKTRSITVENSRLLERVTHEFKEDNSILTVFFKGAVTVNKSLSGWFLTW
jgi:hypothetical protein